MTNSPIDYSQIALQENIPLSEEEIAHIDKQLSLSSLHLLSS